MDGKEIEGLPPSFGRLSAVSPLFSTFAPGFSPRGEVGVRVLSALCVSNSLGNRKIHLYYENNK